MLVFKLVYQLIMLILLFQGTWVGCQHLVVLNHDCEICYLLYIVHHLFGPHTLKSRISQLSNLEILMLTECLPWWINFFNLFYNVMPIFSLEGLFSYFLFFTWAMDNERFHWIISPYQTMVYKFWRILKWIFAISYKIFRYHFSYPNWAILDGWKTFYKIFIMLPTTRQQSNWLLLLRIFLKS